MIYSACCEWLSDWTTAYPPVLVDEWDLAHWLQTEMTDAVETFLTYGFSTHRGRNDALQILRALLYEYYLWEKDKAVHALSPIPHIVSSLRALPQTDQKSPAWFRESRELLTGHEFGSVCYGGAKTREAVVRKKCSQLAVDETITTMNPTVFCADEDGRLSAFKWGWRFEPVVRAVFERVVAGGTVYDGLGRIRHPTLPRLAASPDGLILEGPRQGRLLEIKAPLSRILTGTIPLDYWCQMQLQAEVCGVEAVDYVEARLASSPVGPTAAQWAAAKLGVLGVLFVVSPSLEGSPKDYEYVYSPVFSNLAECLAFRPDLSEGASVVETCVWWVEDWSTTTVLRNRRWWSTVGQPAYEAFWRDVDEARASGRFEAAHGFLAPEEGESEEKGDATPHIHGVPVGVPVHGFILD
jgi:hypothetical protein